MTRDKEADRFWLVSSLSEASKRYDALPRSIRSASFSSSVKESGKLGRVGSDRR